MIKVKSTQVCILRAEELQNLLSSEKARIQFALKQCNNSRTKAMEMLNIAERTFFRKLRVYHIPYKNEN